MIPGLSDFQVPSGCFSKVTFVGFSAVPPSGITVTSTVSPGLASSGKTTSMVPSAFCVKSGADGAVVSGLLPAF